MGNDGGNPWKTVITVGLGIALGFALKKDPSPEKLLNRDGLEYLKKVISEWRPIVMQSEKDYQISLQQYLLGRFSEGRTRVDREWGMGKSRIDIVLDGRFGLELKFNLKTENEVKRLESQVREMTNELEGTLVVLCGDTSEEIFNRLKENLSFEGDMDELICDVVRIPHYAC